MVSLWPRTGGTNGGEADISRDLIQWLTADRSQDKRWRCGEALYQHAIHFLHVPAPAPGPALAPAPALISLLSSYLTSPCPHVSLLLP